MTRPRAAVDSGTNSTRLLVVDGRGRELHRLSTVTRLGQGVDATGRLDPEALERTLAVIAEYRDRWTDAGVDPADVRIAATSAVRDARNRRDYVDRVRELTGVEPEVVPGEREAELSYCGAMSRLDVATPALVCDVGGGSTELVVGDAEGAVLAAHSMQVGSVRLTERCLADDPPTASQVAAARAVVDEALARAVTALRDAGAALDAVRTVVAVAGTATTLGALHAGRDEAADPQVHGHRVPAEDLRGWTDRLLDMTVADRAALPPVVSGREDVIAAGAVVLERVLARTAADAVVVSLADNLDGLVLSMA